MSWHWTIDRGFAGSTLENWQRTGTVFVKIFRLILNVLTIVFVCLRFWKGLLIVAAFGWLADLGWRAITMYPDANLIGIVQLAILEVLSLLGAGCVVGVWWAVVWSERDRKNSEAIGSV